MRFLSLVCRPFLNKLVDLEPLAWAVLLEWGELGARLCSRSSGRAVAPLRPHVTRIGAGAPTQRALPHRLPGPLGLDRWPLDCLLSLVQE